MKFTERSLELSIMELFENEGYTHQTGSDIHREKSDVLLYDLLATFLRYRRDIPELFKYNAFVVISDGANSKIGSLFSPYEYFYAWRKVESGDKESDGISSLMTLVRGLFRKDRLLSVVKDFVYFPDSRSKETKIICRYPQFFAVQALYKSICAALRPNGNGNGGIYFGATGCGKSYTMVFLSRLLMHSKVMESPTI